jgi:hypothetical protein
MPNINQQSLVSVTKNLTATRKTNPQCWFSSKTIKKTTEIQNERSRRNGTQSEKDQTQRERRKTRKKERKKQEEEKEQSTLKIVTYNFQNKF